MPLAQQRALHPGFLLASAALIYSTWLVSPLLGVEIPSTTGYVSELSAGTQPLSWLFRTSDVIAGVLFAAAASMKLRTEACDTSPWVHRVGWGAVVLLGVATILDAIFPMSCAPSLDERCRAAGAAGALPLSDTIHLVTSGTAGAALALSALLAWSAEFSRRRRTTRGLAIAVVLTCAWASVAALVDEGSGLNAEPGLAQRVQLIVTLFYFVMLAHTLWRRP